MKEFLVPALVFGLSFAVTPLIRRFALRIGALDYPDSRKIHRQAMPLLGGLAIYLSFWPVAALTFLLLKGEGPLWGLFWGSTIIVALGLYDDLKGLSYKAKLAGQFAAALVLLAYNIRIEFITLPFKDLTFLGLFVIPLTLLWVVGLTNAVNLIDGVDGLATGVSAIAAIVMFALTWKEFPLISILVLALAGAALGFLPYNFFPARIFLGDTGSLFLGFMLAGFSIMGLTKQATLTTLLIPAIIFGLPITDTFYAIWRRFRNGQPIFKADKGHIHHRLLGLGLNARQTVVILYLSSICFGIFAFVFDRLSGPGAYLIPVVFLAFVFGLKHLGVLGNLLSAFGSLSYQEKQEQEQKRIRR